METINHECYVSLEVAKLLKQAGFDWVCRKIYYCYHEDGDKWELEDNFKNHQRIIELDDCLLAPTLDVVQRWLIKKNLLIYICPIHVDGKWLWRYWFVNCIDKEDIIQIYSTEKYEIHEEAQEACEKKALELILEKGE